MSGAPGGQRQISTAVPLETGFSVYLDLVRVSAALVVLYSHTNVRLLTTNVLPGEALGHSAVVVFFVLSGFVIAYVTDTRETTPADYAASRVARIYSVVLPALLLPLVADAFGQALFPNAYEGDVTTHGLPALRIALSVLMLNQSWGLSVQPFSNRPYWSIPFEVWYYVLFGVVVFLTGRRRTLALCLAALLCGPKILLLLPIWLMGVYLYRSQFWRRLDPGVASALYAVSTILVIVFHVVDVEGFCGGLVKRVLGPDALDTLTYSSWFLGDYILGVLVFLNFAAFRAASPIVARPLLWCEAPIRRAALFTFPLYLFHRPLLVLAMAIIRGDPRHPLFYAEVVCLAIAGCVVLGVMTERLRRRLRPGLVVYFRRIVRRDSYSAKVPMLRTPL
jgi:peptidoglycan/LPS O-acetylase OafA/YrhL